MPRLRIRSIGREEKEEEEEMTRTRGGRCGGGSWSFKCKFSEFDCLSRIRKLTRHV